MMETLNIKSLSRDDRVHFLALAFDYWDKFSSILDMLEDDFGAAILREIDCVCNREEALGVSYVFYHKSLPGKFFLSDLRVEYRLVREGKKKVDANIRSAMIEAVGRVISKKPHVDNEEAEYARKKLSAQHVDDIVNPSNWSEYLGEVNAESALDDVLAIMRDRAKQYDSPQGERSMDKVVESFNIITGHNLSASDGYMLMSLLKLVRSQNSSRPDALVDSVKDNIAYAALYGETLCKERQSDKG